ncbi:MAG: hypothetical protein R3308_07955, partial [Thiohalobacterales bacterium]|nr:hypothetical protein [Thiohalobacterales bacterium]
MKTRHCIMQVLLCATLAAPAYAETEVEQLRQEIRLMREEYEQRMRAMEERLQEAEKQAAQRPSDTSEQSAPVTAARPPVSGNAFNPAISATVQAKLSGYSRDPEDADIPGFQVGGETGLPPEGFSLDETEITISANVDQAFYGEITLGLHEDEGETEVDVEEAFFETLALPGGLSVRGGR